MREPLKRFFGGGVSVDDIERLTVCVTKRSPLVGEPQAVSVRTLSTAAPIRVKEFLEELYGPGAGTN
jgi:hypothetical protein